MNNPNQLFREARARSGAAPAAISGIKAEVLHAYRRAKAGDRAAMREVDRMLGRRPWMCSVFVDGTGAPPNPQYDAAGAAALRKQLDEAIAS
jgi:hypothetical protein